MKLYLLVEVGEDCTAPILDVNSYFKSSIRYSGFFPVANIDAFQGSRILLNHRELYSANRYYHRSTTFSQWAVNKRESVNIVLYLLLLDKIFIKLKSRFSFVFSNSGFSNPKKYFLFHIYISFLLHEILVWRRRLEGWVWRSAFILASHSVSRFTRWKDHVLI